MARSRKIDRAAKGNFLASLTGLTAAEAYANLRSDADSYGWNAETRDAIANGTRAHFAKKEPAFVLKTPRGTYFKRFSGIGPMLGATLADAARFSSRDQALAQLGRHWAMGECELVELSS